VTLRLLRLIWFMLSSLAVIKFIRNAGGMEAGHQPKC
jgi:hypothetical protein